MADFAQTISADLTVVGPELPMVLGIADEFVRRGMPIFSPSRAAAEIEGSKAFAREFMTRHKIPSPRYEICGSHEEALAFVARAPFGFPFVVKADGLAAGKGSLVVKDAAGATTAVAGAASTGDAGSGGNGGSTGSIGGYSISGVTGGTVTDSGSYCSCGVNTI